MNGLLPFVTTSLPANTLEGITSNSQTNLAFLEATAAAAVANDALQTLLSGSSDSGSLAPPSTSSILDISLNSKGKSLNVALNASKQEEEIEMNQTSCISNGRVSSTKPSFPQLSNDKVSMKRKILALDDETIRNASRAITREERIDLEELESFAQKFKRQRIKFGFTQGDVGMALGRRYGTDFSQTTISRFEALNLSFKNMCKLRPLLKEWLADAEAAIANGASVSDLLEINPNDSQSQCLDNSLGSLAASSGICEPPSPNGSGISGSGIPLRKRRKRTNLDLSQRSALDAYFNLNPRPDHDKMAEIAELLELDRDVVRVWFCNRRQKLRRE
ncbi:unnamed protein product [Dracunculus medinensis]|uniref:POU domain protein n=1 Tax=Dracunculus medinensis TaxID=318479 RepID=A0A0N4U8X1_DRAME|nr:unnamed protein product [Dracunculus medinensis]